MKYKLEINPDRPIKNVLVAWETEVGDIMIVVDSTHRDNILLHTYNGFIDLGNPVGTWDLNCSLEVELINPGTKIILTIL